MEISFWQKLSYSFQFNQNFWHNFGLGLVYFFVVTLVWLLIRWGISYMKAKVAHSQKEQDRQRLLKTAILPLVLVLLVVTALFTSLTFFLGSANTWTNLDYMVSDEKEGQYLTTVNEQHSTNDQKKGIMSGKSYLVMHRMEVNNPPHRWTNRLAKMTTTTQDAKLIGETQRTILYYSGEWIGAVNKSNGKSTISKKQFYDRNPELAKSKVSDAYYDKEVDKIYVKMDTDTNYEVNSTTFKATAIQEKPELDNVEQATDQEEKIHHRMNGRANVILNPEKSPYFTMLASKEQIEKIKEIREYTLNFNLDVSDERQTYYLYDSAFSIPDSKIAMQRKMKKGFIEGHFLTIPNAKPNRFTVDTKVKEERFSMHLPTVSENRVKELPTSDVFGSMVKTVAATTIKSNENEPIFVTNHSQGLIIHRKTTDNQDVESLLSSVDLLTGKVQWTIDLYHLSHLDLMNEKTIMAYSESDFQVMFIDVKTGETRGYDYRYNRQIQ